jgi:hypothetical protein
MASLIGKVGKINIKNSSCTINNKEYIIQGNKDKNLKLKDITEGDTIEYEIISGGNRKKKAVAKILEIKDSKKEREEEKKKKEEEVRKLEEEKKKKEQAKLKALLQETSSKKNKKQKNNSFNGEKFEIKNYHQGNFPNAFKIEYEKISFNGTQLNNIRPIKNREFNYPYNFVKSDFSKIIREKIFEKKDDKIIKIINGNNSGKIKFKIENLTPLLVLNENNNEGQVNYSAKDENGNYIIPASSLKGMIRNVYETITNSCYSILEDRDEYMLDMRISFDKLKQGKTYFGGASFNNGKVKRIAGRIVKKDNKFYLEKMDAAWINDKYVKEKRASFDNLEKECFEMEVIKNLDWESNSNKKNVRRLKINLVPTHYDLHKTNGKTGSKKYGYIKDTGVNFYNKHYQRFFYYKNEKKAEKIYELDEKVIEKYNVLLKKSKEEMKKILSIKIFLEKLSTHITKLKREL